MALNQLCTTLQKCAEKLEEEIKRNINEFNNKFLSKHVDETRLALERAKDYHYKEVVDAANEVLKNIKIIIFHQDKIEWLSKETNFSEQDLKRFSYVRRQVYAFSKTDEKHSLSRSEENLSVLRRVKRDSRRRTESNISIGSLEAWEKYLDKKEKDESEVIENAVEVKKMVPKRSPSNARARKKFVSSTMGGFLDDERRKNNLDSILENSTIDEDVESAEYEIESRNNEVVENVPEFHKDGFNEVVNKEYSSNNTSKFDIKVSNDLVLQNNKNNEDMINELMSSFLESEEEVEPPGVQQLDCDLVHDSKPKIVDVVFKKNLS